MAGAPKITGMERPVPKKMVRFGRSLQKCGSLRPAPEKKSSLWPARDFLCGMLWPALQSAACFGRRAKFSGMLRPARKFCGTLRPVPPARHSRRRTHAARPLCVCASASLGPPPNSSIRSDELHMEIRYRDCAKIATEASPWLATAATATLPASPTQRSTACAGSVELELALGDRTITSAVAVALTHAGCCCSTAKTTRSQT